MLKNFKSLLLIAVIAIAFASCKDERQTVSYWETDEAWFQTGKEIDENFVDAFYIVSTNVMHSFDSSGKEHNMAVLNEDERKTLAVEMEYVKNTIFPDSINYYSPYYHQFTMSSIALPKNDFQAIYDSVKNEIFDAFDYYMQTWNNGHRFVIIGFSQGAMMTKELLKHLDNEQYSRLVAAYVIGDGISEEDLKCEHIVPAESASDTGVTISFNSVKSPDGIWIPVYENSVTCINPINWTTDATPADFSFGEQNVTATIDTALNVVMVEDFVKPDVPFEEVWPEDCLHFYDIQFYNKSLKENVLLRAYKR
ncbi:MAG: DUF3089 domain-containing protein [Bacteroidales bacterium]|nr:DUF3089 domain-containing protein [Bacteroidales bacterium]